MGFIPSPSMCTRGYRWVEKVIQGDRLKKDNPFRWGSVVLNFPGDSIYD